MVKAEKRKTKKTKHSKTKKTITSSKKSQQSIEMETETHEHDEQMHTFTEQPLQSSHIEYDSLAEHTTTEIVTDSAIEQKAQSIHHAIYPSHEVSASQIGDAIAPIEMQECKSHAVVDALQSLNVSELNVNESAVSTKFDEVPKAAHILPSLSVKQSLTSDETLPNDTYDDLRIADKTLSATARLEYIAVEAKIVDVPYVQESESPWTDKTPSLPREKAAVSVKSVHPIVIQHRNVEETVFNLPDDIPIKPTSIDFDVPHQKSLNITEIVSEQESSPFQSEPLAPSATAVADFELHRPYNVEETRPSENEKTIPISTALEKQANVNVSCLDSVAVDQAIVNEFESDLIVSKPETANAEGIFKPYHTTETNAIEHYETNDSLDDFKYGLSRAEFEMNEHRVTYTETTNVYQSEEEMMSRQRPDQKQATSSFVTLKSTVTEQLMPNELESELFVDSANVEYAMRTTEQSKAPEIGSVQSLETIQNEINVLAAHEKQTAKVDFELQKSAMENILVYSNEKETDLLEENLQVQPIVRHDIVENSPIESSITETLDSERFIDLEQPQFRQSKVVPGHALTVSSVNLIESSDTVDSVPEYIEANRNAKLMVENMYGVSAHSVQPSEQTTDGIDSAKPDYKFASPDLLCENAIEISTQMTEETFSKMETNSSKVETLQIPLKPSDSLLQSTNILESYSLENVGDVHDFDIKKELKTADTHFDEHYQVNVSETLTSEQIGPEGITSIWPSTARATSKFTPKTATAVSVVLPSDSTRDVTYDLPEIAESMLTFDTNKSLYVQQEVCQETITEIPARDESKQYRPSSSFVHQIAKEQMEVDSLENPDVLDLKKADRHIGSTSIENAFVAPEVSNILIHSAENVLDVTNTKPTALAKATADNLNAYERTEYVVLESSDSLKETESRIDSQASQTARQEAFSYSVYSQNVFEKESTIEVVDKAEPENIKFTLESPLKPADVTENIQLFSVEPLPRDHIKHVAPIKSKRTKNLISSAAEETTIIYESEDYKEIGSGDNLTKATVNVKPQHHVIVETNEINYNTTQLLEGHESKARKCRITNEPCLPVSLSETIQASEIPIGQKQMHNELKMADFRVDETHKIETFETTANIDYLIPRESTVIRPERELRSLEIIEKDKFEKEIDFLSPVSDELLQSATTVEQTKQNLIKPVKSYQEKISIHTENDYYKEQLEHSRKTLEAGEGKLICELLLNFKYKI